MYDGEETLGIGALFDEAVDRAVPPGGIGLFAAKVVEFIGALAIYHTGALKFSGAIVDDTDGGTGPDLLEAQRHLLEQAGGFYTVGGAAQRLGITKKAVRRRLQEGRLLSLQHSSEVWLPKVQFDEGGAGTLEGLERVLEAMHVTDDWMRLQLLLDDDVIGALRDGDVEDAVSAADSYLPRDQHAR